MVILLVALIVLGPAKLPEAARKMAQAMSEFRRMSSGLQAELRDALDPLDLKGDLIRRAKEFGVKFMIDTDAHAVGDLSYLEYGIAQARRGWCGKGDVLNTLGAKDFMALLKKPKAKRFS